MKSKKLSKLIALMLTVLLVVGITACGGSEDTVATETETPSEVVEEELEEVAEEIEEELEEEADDADSDLAYIQDKGTLIVGVTEYEPMDFRDGDDWVGFDAELATMFAESLGVEVIIQEINWATKEVELAANTIDCIWNGMTWSEERAEQMSLSDPYLNNKQALVVRAEEQENYTSVEDLAGKQVAAEAGSAGEKFVIENLLDSNYVEKNSQLDSLTELALNSVDATVVDLIMAEYLTGKEGSDFGDLVPLPDLLDSEDEVFVVAFRQDSDLTDIVNEFFEDLEESGELEELAEKYSLTEALITD